jgi:hypothetical protein
MESNLCVFILTHGRPNNVVTYNTIRKSGYNGQVFLVIDNEDETANQYRSKFGAENVIMFDKAKTARNFDEFDNFEDRRTIVYARNECFKIAKRLGYEYFLELDDDYTKFGFRSCTIEDYNFYGSWVSINSTLELAFNATLEFYKAISAKSIAFSQGGDWMQKFAGDLAFSRRKCMNTFFCATSRPFDFVGRINEDVNTYTWYQSQGNLFLTIPLIQVCQKQTQHNAGGMTDIYLNQGTYIKSFYSIICSPNCVSIRIMGSTNRRMHHKVNWDCAVPMLIDEKHRKATEVVAPKLKALPMVTLPPKESVTNGNAPKKTLPPPKKKEIKPEKNFDIDNYWKDRGFCGSIKLTDSITL